MQVVVCRLFLHEEICVLDSQRRELLVRAFQGHKKTPAGDIRLSTTILAWPARL